MLLTNTPTAKRFERATAQPLTTVCLASDEDEPGRHTSLLLHTDAATRLRIDGLRAEQLHDDVRLFVARQ